MQMIACKSSQIKAHGHDPATNTLAIEYHSGHTYHYQDVSPDQYDALSKAESIGSHFHANIKGNHDFVKVTK